MFSGEAVEKHRRNKQMPGATGKGKIATQKCQNKQTTTTPPQKKITPRNKDIYQFSDKQEKKSKLGCFCQHFFLISVYLPHSVLSTTLSLPVLAPPFFFSFTFISDFSMYFSNIPQTAG